MRFIVPIVAAFAAAGCIESEQDYTLNPDGSGKVAVTWAHAPLDMGPGDRKPDEAAKKAVKDEIEQCEGVDAWKDVTWTLRDDGKVQFKGVAYFKDLSKLHLHLQGMKLTRLRHVKEAGGLAVVLEFGDKAEDRKPEPISDEDAKAKVKTERAQYQQSKPLFESMLKELKSRVKVSLPGAVGAASNFKKAGGSAVECTLEGKALFKLLDELMMDDAWLTKQIKERGGLKGGPITDEASMQKLFGEKGPVRAATSGALKASFDYEAEAAPARAAMAELLKKFGGKGPAAPPSKGGAFKDLKVAGVQIVYAFDAQRGMMPLNTGQAGLKIALVGELPGSVLAMKEGRLEKAVSDAGDDLLPKEKFHRAIHWPRLSTDKGAVCFEVQLNLPGEKAKGIKELSGVLQYVVGEKTKSVDLGIAEFNPGAKGRELGAEIAKVEDSQFQQGHQQLELKLKASMDAIQSVDFLDEGGTKLAVRASGHWQQGETTQFTYTLKGKFPPKGKIVVNLYDDLKTYEIPFKVENVDLLGRPLK